MCGIAGYYGLQIPDQNRLQQTSNVLRHRGPDGEGIYTHQFQKNGVALVHRRLAIIDLDERSNQPFRLDKCVLVFNGEIYNYLELRLELANLGHAFRTSGDTEVLAHALKQWGIAALDRLEGMWAFAWYDEDKGNLLLSRDRFGEKPLYYWNHSGGLYFSSEIKGLAAMAGEWPAHNENHLLRYLINGYKALHKTPETFYQGVEELQQACCLNILPRGAETPRSYWQPSLKEDESLSYEDAVAMTRESLIDALKIRMRSDVPLAFCMSGGVDSNSLISIARYILNCDVHGFTILNSDARYEEQALVEEAVNNLNLRHTNVELEQKGFLDKLQKLVKAHDAPISTISYYVHWQLMEAVAAAGYKVTISGTGADELFTGYYDHHNLYLYEVSKDKVLYQKSLEAWRKHQAPIVRNPHLQDPDLYLKDPSFREHIYLNRDLFSSWLTTHWEESFIEKDYGVGLLRNRMLNELFEEAVPVMLHEDDHNAMFFSLENRSPFLNSHLFEMAYQIPSRHLVRDARAKSVLRDAMRGIVPDTILDERRKVGFNAPILELLDVNDLEVRDLLMCDGAIYEIVKKSSIEDLLNNENMTNSMSKFIFNFINVKFFLETKE